MNKNTAWLLLLLLNVLSGCSLFGWGETPQGNATEPVANTANQQPAPPQTPEDQQLMVSDEAIVENKAACADQRTNLAFDLTNRSKYYLGSYYQTRNQSDAYFAWYAAQESKLVLNSIRNCHDKQNKHFRAVQNIMQVNQQLEKNIQINLRGKSYGSLTHIFWDEYKKVFPRDIQ